MELELYLTEGLKTKLAGLKSHGILALDTSEQGYSREPSSLVRGLTTNYSISIVRH